MGKDSALSWAESHGAQSRGVWSYGSESQGWTCTPQGTYGPFRGGQDSIFQKGGCLLPTGSGLQQTSKAVFSWERGLLPPPLTQCPVSFGTRNSHQDLQQAVDSLLLKGAVETVDKPSSLWYYSQLFLVPKKTGDLILAIDLSQFNSHLNIPHFKMETQASIRSAICQGEWAVSVDIRDAYLHVPMSRDVRRYLRLKVNRHVYQFTCLPFGLATSPREFTKLLRPVVTLLRLKGIRLHVYLDDWLICASSPAQAQLHANLVIRVLQHLGWIINFDKSELQPSQTFDFIGMQFNTRTHTVVPLPKMPVKVSNTLDHWRSWPWVTAWDLHRLLGILNIMATLMPKGRMRLRPIQWWAKEAWCQEGLWSDLVLVTPSVLYQVAWWASPAVLQGVQLSTRESGVDTLHRHLMSWMGCTAWRGLSPRVLVGGPAPMPHQCARVGSCPLRSQGLLSIPPTPCGASAVWQRRGHCVHSEGRRDAIVQVDQACDLPPEILRPDEYQLGSSVPSRISQHPSRRSVACGTDPADRVVDPLAAAGSGVHLVGHTMYRFVCDLREQEATNIRITIPGREGQIRGRHVSSVDGMGMVYALPPFRMLPAVLSKIQTSCDLSVILIAPWTLSASWMPDQLQMCREAPMPLAQEELPLLEQEVLLPDGDSEGRH